MIGVNGQYALNFKIDTYDDFITPKYLNHFAIIEEANNSLARFTLTFEIHDRGILDVINEGNDLHASLGKSKEEMTESKLHIMSKTVGKSGKGVYVIKIEGLVHPLAYMTDQKIKTFPKMSGVEAIYKVVNSAGFTPQFNISTSEDSMNWIQPAISDREFVENTWLHSYISNSFIAVGITSDNKFVLKDMAKEAKKDPTWIFSNADGIDSKRVPFMFESEGVTSESGFFNMWSGYNKKLPLYDLDKGVYSTQELKLTTMLAQQAGLDRNPNVGARFNNLRFTNKNVHKNYWLARQQNLGNLSIFSSNRLVISYNNYYLPHRVLDFCMFKDVEAGGSQANEGSYSGKYIISKISRNISEKSITTLVELSRETMSEQKGKFQI